MLCAEGNLIQEAPGLDPEVPVHDDLSFPQRILWRSHGDHAERIEPRASRLRIGPRGSEEQVNLLGGYGENANAYWKVR